MQVVSLQDFYDQNSAFKVLINRKVKAGHYMPYFYFLCFTNLFCIVLNRSFSHKFKVQSKYYDYYDYYYDLKYKIDNFNYMFKHSDTYSLVQLKSEKCLFILHFERLHRLKYCNADICTLHRAWKHKSGIHD